jgi:hypothetical protein
LRPLLRGWPRRMQGPRGPFGKLFAHRNML